MILSAVILNNYFVQIIAGSHLHQTLTPSFKNFVTTDPRMWIQPPPNKPPDPSTRTCKIKFSHHKKLNKGSNNNVYTMNNTNVTYSTLNAQQRNKRGTLVDRGANGGIAGSDTCIINTHLT